MNIKQIIEAAAEEAAKKTVAELKRSGLLRATHSNNYQRTESLLRKYGENNVTAEQAAAVERALADINGETYAPVVQLYYFDGKTNAQIAELVHASEKTVARGRQRLVQKLSAKIGKI